MALINKVNTSNYGPKSPSENKARYNDVAFKQSKVHDQFSINGDPQLSLGKGVNPSGLDLNGVTPTGPLKDPGTISINKTFSKGKYEDNLPEGVSI